MKSIIEKTIVALMLVCATGGAWAATPVAEWDGAADSEYDFSNLTHNGYVLGNLGSGYYNSVATDYSYLQIGNQNQKAAITLKKSSGNMGASTVIIKCENMMTKTGANRAVLSFMSSDSNPYIGVAQENTTGDHTSSFICENYIWNNASNVRKQDAFSGGKMTIALAYAYASGTAYYVDGELICAASNLKSSTFNPAGVCIGGVGVDGSGMFYTMQGMKITAIAFFDSKISNDDIAAYRFPSERIQTIAVNANISVSDINGQFDSANYWKADVTVADGVTITMDAAFSSKIRSVSSEGNVTLFAASQPDASYFSSVDFSGVEGALIRSWLMSDVVGFNFNGNGARTYGTPKVDSSIDVSSALVSGTWVHNADAISGSSTALFNDGISTLTWQSKNLYAVAEAGSTGTFLNGYLDDGDGGATITISPVPYETYDVIIYCATDTGDAKFSAKTVNGTTYTWDATSSSAIEGTGAWGASGGKDATAVLGTNAIRVNNLNGSLSINGGASADDGKTRGGIAAIQVVPREYTLTLDGTDKAWSDADWKYGDDSAPAAPTSGYAKINVSASTTLTIDETVALDRLVIQGADNAVLTLVTDGGSLVANVSVTVKGGVLQQGSASVLGATPAIVIEDGGTFDMNGLGINSATKVYLAGDGAGAWPWALTSSSGAGEPVLGGLYLTADATIGGANELKIGQTQAGYYCYLQGFTLTKTGSGALKCTNMNTQGTGTIDVQGGAMSVNQWNNLNSAVGDTTVILHSGTSLANNTDRVISIGTLKLLGGTLTTTRAFKVKTLFTGSGETANLTFAAGASASLTGNLTVTSALTLDGAMTFNKDEDAASDVVVTASGTLSSSGAITVGAGVTLNLGTNRPTGEITVEEGGTLAVKQKNATDIIELAASAKPASIVLYDTNGDVVSSTRVTYSSGKLTIMLLEPTLEANGTVAFDTASNWDDSTMPEANGDAIIELLGDAAITVASDYTLGNLTITGSGEVSFSGAGSVSAANIYLKNGAKLSRNANRPATTAINLDSGTVLKLNGVTEAAAISGAGAVETYGTVVLGHANTMTGGITVKSGSMLSASASGAYGEYSSGWAYSAQRQVVVEDGGTVDINNIANADAAVALTVAGNGVVVDGVYAGAVKYSGSSAIGNGSRQISSLVLTGDALIDIGVGWGLVHSGWGNSRLGLNGHTLTVRGTGTFPVVNANNASGATTTGTLILDGAKLELSKAASNLTGVNIVVKGCSSIDLSTAPSALGSLTLKPTASGTTASAWNLPAGFVPVVDTTNVDFSGLSDNQVVTLFTAPGGTTLTSSTISAQVSGRYTATISGNTVTATFKSGMPDNFLHYNFDDGVTVSAGKATDSGTQISSFGEASSDTRVDSGNGKAVQVHTNYTPYWGSYANSTSPFHAFEISVTAVAELDQTDVVLWGLGSGSTAIALVATDEHTVKVVARRGSNTVETLATATVTQDLTKGWHFFAVVSDENGTTLYVDDTTDSSAKGVPAGIGQQGQLGSVHGGAFGASKAGANGYYLDDWRVYDAALTADEVADIMKELMAVTITVPVVVNTTVTVTADGVTKDGVDGDGVKTYSVPYGSAVVVTYTAVSGYELSGTATYNIANATSDTEITITDTVSNPYVAQNGSTKFTTLAGAIANTATTLNPVVALLADISESEVAVSSTIVFSGAHTINSAVKVADGGILQLMGATLGGKLTIEGGGAYATTGGSLSELVTKDGAAIQLSTLNATTAPLSVTTLSVEGKLTVLSSWGAGVYGNTYKAISYVTANATIAPGAEIAGVNEWSASVATDGDNTVVSLTFTKIAMVDGVYYDDAQDAVDAAVTSGEPVTFLAAPGTVEIGLDETLIVAGGTQPAVVMEDGLTNPPYDIAVTIDESTHYIYTVERYVAKLKNPVYGTKSWQDEVKYTSLAGAVADVILNNNVGYDAGYVPIVTLLDDIVLDATVTVGRRMKLDLNGKALTASGVNAISNGSILTIQGSSGSFTVTSGNSVVLNASAATVAVTGGVTLSPAPVSGVELKYVKDTASEGTTTYALQSAGEMDGTTATITNAVANVILPESSTGLNTVLNGNSVTYAYSGSDITDENKGSTVSVFASDANGQIISGTPITSYCTVTVADGTIAVALNAEAVRPEPVTNDATNPPMAMGDGTVSFALPLKQGLWYTIESGSNIDAYGNIVEGARSTPYYHSSATGTGVVSATLPSGTVIYFKAAVGASKAAVR